MAAVGRRPGPGAFSPPVHRKEFIGLNMPPFTSARKYDGPNRGDRIVLTGEDGIVHRDSLGCDQQPPAQRDGEGPK